MLLIRVFVPFVFGFYLSYLYRVINALIAPDILSELHLGASGLGLLTSVYFLTFGVCQLPVGALLDRFGPRRVQAALMLVAASGAFVFAFGAGSWALIAGRGLIGIGVSAAWVGGLKATVTWFPKERLSLVNGWMLALGSLGAVTATGPADMAVHLIGWRGLFVLLGVLSLAASGIVYMAVPEAVPGGAPAVPRSSGRLRDVCLDRDFLRIAPLWACAIGTAWAVQGLWAGRWLADVDGYNQRTIVTHLFIMSCTLSAGGVLFGGLAHRLRRRGVSTETVFVSAIALYMAVEGLIVAHAPLPSALLWGVSAIFGSLTALGFAIMSELYPKEAIGRANSVIGVMQIAAGFFFQWVMGVLVALWRPEAAGRYPTIAYEAAFIFPLLLQGFAMGWFAWAKLRRVGRAAFLAIPPPHIHATGGGKE